MKQTEPAGPYDQTFYDDHLAGSFRSARILLGRLFEVYRPESVVDVGCGAGAWLAAAESLGSTRLQGLDGDWVDESKLLSKQIAFEPADFSRPLEIAGSFDLCISVEVAEHLAAERAAGFVAALCNAAEVVLFSAAIKHQGGNSHVNEQWQSYWIKLFNNCGYGCFDIFRGAVWNNREVELWYRQNIFLFVKRTTDRIDLKLLKSLEQPIPDVVHPEYYEDKVLVQTNLYRHIQQVEQQIRQPSLRFCLGNFKRYLFNHLKGVKSLFS